MKKILITGGLGFIFSHVTEYFLEKGYLVMVLDNCSAGSHPYLAKEWSDKYEGQIIVTNLDVSYQSAISTIIGFNPSYIVHAAAISDVDYSIKQPTKTLASNNNATINVFEAARQCSNLEKLLYVSTDEVYGECDHPKTEEEIIFPKNPYALSKAFGSLLRLSYDNTYPQLKDKTVETRFCNVFGPRQDDRKILPAIKRALNGGKPVELHNGGTGYRQFIHVSEIPPLIEQILERGDRTYNITAGEGFTVNELIGMAEMITKKVVPTVRGKRSGMDMRYEMSSDRIREAFAWRPKKSFSDHLQEYLCS